MRLNKRSTPAEVKQAIQENSLAAADFEAVLADQYSLSLSEVEVFMATITSHQQWDQAIQDGAQLARVLIALNNCAKKDNTPNLIERLHSTLISSVNLDHLLKTSSVADVGEILNQLPLTQSFQVYLFLMQNIAFTVKDPVKQEHLSYHINYPFFAEVKYLVGDLVSKIDNATVQDESLIRFRWVLKLLETNMSHLRNAVNNINVRRLLSSLKTHLAEIRNSNPDQLSKNCAEVGGKIINLMQAARKELNIPFVSLPKDGLPLTWNAPQGNPDFFMRNSIIDEISHVFAAERANNHSMHIALKGAVGSGKSALANYYFWYAKKNYNAKIWFTGSSAKEVLVEYRYFAEHLNLIDADVSDYKLIRIVNNFLSDTPGWLMVVDNADDPEIASLLPSTGGDILITTRYRNFKAEKSIKVNVFSPEEAIAFYQQQSKKTDADPDVAELVKIFGYLPLAINQAAHYVKISASTTARYLSLFSTRPKSLLGNNALTTGNKEQDMRSNLLTTWQHTLDMLEVKHDKSSLFYSKKIMTRIAFLVHVNIPIRLLEQITICDFPYTSSISSLLNEALGELYCGCSLIEKTELSISINPFVQEVMQIHFPLDNNTVEIITNAFSKLIGIYCNENNKTQLELLIPHITALLNHSIKIFGEDSPETAKVLMSLSKASEVLELDQRSFNMLLQALAIQERCGVNPAEIAQTLKKLLDLQTKAFRQAQAISADASKSHPDTIPMLYNLALIHAKLNHADRANTFLQFALNVMQQFPSYQTDRPWLVSLTWKNEIAAQLIKSQNANRATLKKT